METKVIKQKVISVVEKIVALLKSIHDKGNAENPSPARIEVFILLEFVKHLIYVVKKNMHRDDFSFYDHSCFTELKVRLFIKKAKLRMVVLDEKDEHELDILLTEFKLLNDDLFASMALEE